MGLDRLNSLALTATKRRTGRPSELKSVEQNAVRGHVAILETTGRLTVKWIRRIVTRSCATSAAAD